jgi:hypothetical protein
MFHHLNIDNHLHMDHQIIIDMLYLFDQQDIDMNNYLIQIYMLHQINKENLDNIDLYIDNYHRYNLLNNYKQQMYHNLYKYHHLNIELLNKDLIIENMLNQYNLMDINKYMMYQRFDMYHHLNTIQRNN